MVKNFFHIRRLKKILAKIKSFEKEMSSLSDLDLQKKLTNSKRDLLTGKIWINFCQKPMLLFEKRIKGF